MMLYLEFLAEFGNHLIVEIHTIVSNNSLWDTISTNQIVSDKPRHDVLGHSSKRGRLNPYFEVIYGNQDEVISIGSGRPDFSDHVNAPYCKGARSCQDVQGNQRHMHLISVDLELMASSGVLITICFHSGPVVSCHRIFLAMVCPLEWVPKVPSCRSVIILSASLLSTHRSKVES